jgi:hypothetical protein
VAVQSGLLADKAGRMLSDCLRRDRSSSICSDFTGRPASRHISRVPPKNSTTKQDDFRREIST